MEHFPNYQGITNGTHGISNGFDVQFSGDSYKEILGKYLEFTRSHLLSIALVYLCVLCVFFSVEKESSDEITVHIRKSSQNESSNKTNDSYKVITPATHS